MIKYIFFDMDGVLTTHTTGSYTTCKFFADILDCDFDELFAYIRQYDSDIDSGALSLENLWRKAFEKYNKEYKNEYMYESFLSTPIDSKMLEIVYELKKNYKVGIITDNSIERAEAIFDKNDFRNIFDTLVISEEAKATKKSTKIFKLTATRANVECNECVFIDNNSNNVKVAQEAGFKGIYFNDQERDYNRLFKDILGE